MNSEKQKTLAALDALDAMAETWAEEIGLDAMINKLTSDEQSAVKIRALMMESHIEGLYRGRTSVSCK